jgi:allantoate deiminase
MQEVYDHWGEAKRQSDVFGNLVGRYEGTGNKTLLLGSHLYTVRDAGKYDGPLGVMAGLAQLLQDALIGDPL